MPAPMMTTRRAMPRALTDGSALGATIRAGAKGPNRARAPDLPLGLRYASAAVPTLRQFVLLAALWGLLAWFTTALWGVVAQNHGFADSLTRYYAVRAPVVGAVAGILWAPILCAGMLPGRASALADRAPGLAVERPTRWLFRGIQGAVVGQLVAGSATFALLFLWPNDMQNTRMDALKWAGVFWRVYWWLFIPCGAVAGVLSVLIALRVRPRPSES